MAEPIDNNLLSLNAQDFTEDTSGWDITGADTQIQDLVMVYPDSDPVLLTLATGASPIELALAEPVELVEPGAEHVAYCHAWVPEGASSVATVTVRWLDSTGDEVGVSTETVTLTGGVVARVSVIDVPPEGAVAASMEMTATVEAAGDYVAWDVIYLGVAPNHPGNLYSYDQYSVEVTDGGWVGTGATVERTETPHTGAEGWYVLRVVPEEPGLVTLEQSAVVPVEAGQWYQWGASVWVYAGDPPDTDAIIRVDTVAVWVDESGAEIGTSAPPNYYEAVPWAPFIGVSSVETGQAPPGAAGVRVRVMLLHESTTVTEYTLDKFWITPVSEVYSLSVNNQTGSVRIVMNYTPIFSHDFFGLYRVHPDGSQHPVRGYNGDWDGQPVPTPPLIVEDYECPLGTRVWYIARWWDADGNGTSEVVTSPILGPVLADGGEVWLKSPGLPALNTRITMAAPISWDRKARAGVYQIVGSRYPVVETDVRGSREGALAVHVWDADRHAALDALLDSGLPVLVQAMPGHGIDGNLYLHVGDVSADPLSWNATVPGWRWTLSVVEVDRPTGGLEGSADRTWQIVRDSYDTWDDVASRYATWADVLTGDERSS